MGLSIFGEWYNTTGILTRLIYISLFLMGNLSAFSQNLSIEILLSNNSNNDIHSTASLENNTVPLSAIDIRALGIKPENFSSFSELTDYLVGPKEHQYNKVRSIYSWIASNITYHKESIKDQSQTAQAVWNSQKAVCEGYANLFNAMCQEAGIESRMVKGYVRDFDGEALTFPNHAWNSVKIDGKWYLLDVTWASLNKNPRSVEPDLSNERDIKHKLDYYFLVNPEDMILTHLPEDPYWQLQDKIIDLETFIKGEEFIIEALQNQQASSEMNFEILIDNYEKLDSLDRSIAYLERMVANSLNSSKEYGLGIAYYYKAQSILENANDNYSHQQVKDRARAYYQKSLEYLMLLEKNDFGYDFSKDLADNVLFRIEVLQ